MAASRDQPWVLGYSASHNGAACLLHGDELVVAVQEERVRGEKRARLGRLDESLAVAYCLDHAGIGADDLDAIVGCYFSGARIEGAGITRQGWPGLFLTIPHHLGHAIAAATQSGYPETAVLVVDGQGGPGDWLPADERANVRHAKVPGSGESNEIISIYRADGGGVRCLEKHLGQWVVDAARLGQGAGLAQFGSLGGMFSAVSDFTFGNAMDAGKVMGLAAFGRPIHPVEEFFRIDEVGGFEFSDALPRRYAAGQRWPMEPQRHQDLAASTQAALEQALFHLVRRARELSGSRHLCLVGGVALNNVANEKIIALGEFDQVFIMPAAEDSGPAIGAAYHGLAALRGRPARRAIVHDAPGRRYGAAAIEAAIAATPCLQEITAGDPLEQVVDMLCQGGIVGWFQGGSELGPRALGQRSIIADARPADAKDRLNLRVKHREAFRPFAPVILEERTGDWFELPARQPDSPFMLRTFQFQPGRAAQVPAVVHHDGSGRLQTLTAERNGRFHELVRRFEARTGVPIIVNTSFNVMGEPIVETPEDALFCLLYTDLDAVVLEDRILVRAAAFGDILDLHPVLTATALTLEHPLAGRFEAAVGPNSSIRVQVRKPWGQATFQLPAITWPLLARVDGRRSGRQVLAALRQGGQWPHDERLFRETLRHLRRIGVLTFRAAPGPA